MNKNNTLHIGVIFEGQSLNYGEGERNITALKKMSRDNHFLSYLSKQALKYNIKQQMGIDNTDLELDKSVIQYSNCSTIEESIELDLFGYLKTTKPVKKRSAVVRVSDAISLETYKSDLDFLTNLGLLNRFNSVANETEQLAGGNIAQSEVHKSYYAYTITADLQHVGIDANDNITLSNEERCKRVSEFLDTVFSLYRDIKGRRENLRPIFVVGGLYSKGSSIFENMISVKNNILALDPLKETIEFDTNTKENTLVGVLSGKFDNTDAIKAELGATTVSGVLNTLKEGVKAYYESN